MMDRFSLGLSLRSQRIKGSPPSLIFYPRFLTFRFLSPTGLGSPGGRWLRSERNESLWHAWRYPSRRHLSLFPACSCPRCSAFIAKSLGSAVSPTARQSRGFFILRAHALSLSAAMGRYTIYMNVVSECRPSLPGSRPGSFDAWCYYHIPCTIYHVPCTIVRTIT